VCEQAYEPGQEEEVVDVGVERGGWQPLSRAEPLFFGQTQNFSARSWQPKMKKKQLLKFITRKNGIRSVQRDEVPEIRYFTARY